MMEKLPRVLRSGDLALLTLGNVIGSGIFIVPAMVLQMTGLKVGLALFVWVLGGVLSLLGALTYAELAAMKPEAGGLYIYIRDAFGPFVAFLSGWALFLVFAGAGVAALAVAFAAYLNEFVPLTPWLAKAVAIGMIAIIAAINVAGTRKSTDFQNWTTAIKVGAIVLISVLLLAGGKGFHGATVALPAVDKASLLAIGAATIGVLWAYDGWIYVTFSAGEVVEPQRNFARGIIVGTVAVVALYLLVNVAYIAALGPARSAASQRIAADAAVAVLGPWAGKLVALSILISICSSTHAMVLTASRVYFAMARDGVFFKRMGEVSPRWNTPAFAILTSSIWAAALAATGTFDDLMTDVVFTAFAFYALGAASIFYYRRREPNAVRRFRTPGYPWTPLLFIGAGAAIVANTVIGTPGRAFVGTALVVSGAPVFWFWQTRKRRAQRRANPS